MQCTAPYAPASSEIQDFDSLISRVTEQAVERNNVESGSDAESAAVEKRRHDDVLPGGVRQRSRALLTRLYLAHSQSRQRDRERAPQGCLSLYESINRRLISNVVN
ncbi:hypothetical protein CR513_08806, partial [Mucuna pruriens]